MSKQWIPYLVQKGLPNTRLFLGREFRTIHQMQMFFHNKDKTHPHLRGAHIEFCEEDDAVPVSVVVPARGEGT